MYKCDIWHALSVEESRHVYQHQQVSAGTEGVWPVLQNLDRVPHRGSVRDPGPGASPVSWVQGQCVK